MCSYVNHILVPYLNRMKEELGLSPDHECILELDVWSVHRSKQFRTWMKTTHPWIILDFVPGGCTEIWQPCDVGIQRLMKLSIRHAQHEDLVAEVQHKLRTGVSPADLHIDDTLGTLRNRSVQWLVNAYHTINDKVIVEKVRSFPSAFRLGSQVVL
ncbi:uncharacterized protein PHACADRAFT_97693 [Phanerochaete carnosa HHB-10118-sp]|uniref:DDE-1 domain-containing protein n=1 Tax=Phanerochaete carnosa (strain HHB-10118-sp) TaxID=650164 RepID=K5W4J4_PHACS|nr:uncharacterized protein PHACADRAFT_97693 [Phanerochaete carnosa HHB-10118-sp]EKM53854.1 hypothetical protein PHACADRAFT_97693 [Phanerochaete carnosa HHB-10118-sp]